MNIKKKKYFRYNLKFANNRHNHNSQNAAIYVVTYICTILAVPKSEDSTRVCTYVENLTAEADR